MKNPTSILVTLSLSDAFVALRTTDRRHGRSHRFLFYRKGLEELLNDPYGLPHYDSDLNSHAEVWPDGSNLRFVVNWIGCPDENGEFRGYRQRFEIPMNLVRSVLDGGDVRLVVSGDTSQHKSTIVIAPSAHRQIARLNARERRAISKCLRDAFYWGRDTVTLYGECGKDFFFRSDTICGGVCLHASPTGAVQPVTRYEIHT